VAAASARAARSSSTARRASRAPTRQIHAQRWGRFRPSRHARRQTRRVERRPERVFVDLEFVAEQVARRIVQKREVDVARAPPETRGAEHEVCDDPVRSAIGESLPRR
jgi:hypothetical protein